eukprot:Nk52_evm29s78 gene=Nk52_evmTU29s78
MPLNVKENDIMEASPKEKEEDPKKIRTRRTKLPAVSPGKVSIVSFLKNAFSQDLSKLSFPTDVLEPISMLQRVCEELDYAEILDKAAAESCPCKRFAYIYGFTIAPYCTFFRGRKPFTPLLGETFELDLMKERGFRAVAEQVSVNPSIIALHCESSSWSFDFNLEEQISFMGTYITVNPKGNLVIKIYETGDVYVCNRPNGGIYNILFGTMYGDIYGDVKLENVATGEYLKIPYRSYSDIGDSYKEVHFDGFIDGKYIQIDGNWDEFAAAMIDDVEYMEIFKMKPFPSSSAQMYDFSNFTLILNEEEKGVPATDSRNRSDIRMLEKGRISEAQEIKTVYETKERMRISMMERQGFKYEPAWFKKAASGAPNRYVFNNLYWKCKDSDSFPHSDIFESVNK